MNTLKKILILFACLASSMTLNQFNKIFAMDSVQQKIQTNTNDIQDQCKNQNEHGFYSNNWHIGSKILRQMKKKSYESYYQTSLNSEDKLNNIYAIEDKVTHDLDIYLFNNTLSNSGDVHSYSFTLLNTYNYER